MCLAAQMSHRLGWLDAEALGRARRLIAAARLPVDPPPEIDTARFLELMAVDKKVQAGRLRLVLLRAIGDPVVTADFSADALRATLEARSGSFERG
jgi:3-dehydroquinate synthase